MGTRLVIGCATILLATLDAASPRSAAQIAGPTFSARSELVVLNVTVTDRFGGYVAGLDRTAFTLFEDDRPRPIDFFSVVDAPATVGLLIDDSASMVGTMKLVAAAAETFAATSNPADELFALAFNDTVRPAMTRDVPFATSPAALKAAVEGAITMRGRTALHDAVLDGISYAARGRHARRVVVIVSDGEDTASAVDFNELLLRVQGSSTVIYTVAVRDPSGAAGRPDRLKALAAATGGQAFRADTPSRVGAALSTIARDIRHAYTIGYTPERTEEAAVFHRLHVTVTSVDGEKLHARTRQGFVDETY